MKILKKFVFSRNLFSLLRLGTCEKAKYDNCKLHTRSNNGKSLISFEGLGSVKKGLQNATRKVRGSVDDLTSEMVNSLTATHSLLAVTPCPVWLLPHYVRKWQAICP